MPFQNKGTPYNTVSSQVEDSYKKWPGTSFGTEKRNHVILSAVKLRIGIKKWPGTSFGTEKMGTIRHSTKFPVFDSYGGILPQNLNPSFQSYFKSTYFIDSHIYLHTS